MINEVPLFPLNTVLFPGGLLPLRIFEQRYMDMAKDCLREESFFGICLIREGAEVGAPATPVDVGCLARIASWDMPQLGLLHITARGEQRFRIKSRTVQRDGLARGSIELLAQDSDGEIAQDCAVCVRLLERIIEEQARLFEPPHRLESASWVGSRLAEMLPLPLGVKQELLEMSDAVARLERLTALLRPGKR
jgi:Lon protease-like protein